MKLVGKMNECRTLILIGFIRNVYAYTWNPKKDCVPQVEVLNFKHWTIRNRLIYIVRSIL